MQELGIIDQHYIFLVFFSEWTHNISGLANSFAELPCNTSHPGHDEVLLVLWFKDPEDQRPFYTYDNRGEADKHWSDDDFLGKGRGLFQLGGPGPKGSPGASLALDDLRPADQGVFRCRVDFKFAPTSVTKTHLTVIGINPHSWCVCQK